MALDATCAKGCYKVIAITSDIKRYTAAPVIRQRKSSLSRLAAIPKGKFWSSVSTVRDVKTSKLECMTILAGKNYFFI